MALGWTREELARRTGIAIDTLKRFEQTGQVSLERLLRVALTLDALREFTTLFPEPTPASLAELEARVAARTRRRVRARGLRSDAGTGTESESTTASNRGRAVKNEAAAAADAPAQAAARRDGVTSDAGRRPARRPPRDVPDAPT